MIDFITEIGIFSSKNGSSLGRSVPPLDVQKGERYGKTILLRCFVDPKKQESAAANRCALRFLKKPERRVSV